MPIVRRGTVLAGVDLASNAAVQSSDALISALAIEAGATVVTYDGDFARFSDVRWLAGQERAAGEPRSSPRGRRRRPPALRTRRRHCHRAAPVNVTLVYCISPCRYHGSIAILTGR